MDGRVDRIPGSGHPCGAVPEGNNATRALAPAQIAWGEGFSCSRHPPRAGNPGGTKRPWPFRAGTALPGFVPGPRSLLLLFLALALFLAPGCQPSGRTGRGHPSSTEPASPVELNAEVDPAEAKVAEPVTFRITLDADPAIRVSIPDVGSRIEGLRIVDMGRQGPRNREGRLWSQRWYEVVADFAGSYILPPVKLDYTDPEGKARVAETAQLFLEVKPALEEGAGGQDIRDIKPLEKVKRRIPRTAYFVTGAVLLVLALGAGLVWFFRKRKRIREAERSPEDMARDELETLDASGLLEEERYREYVFGLSLIFRRYLERRFRVPAAEQTTEEIFTSLRQAEYLDKELKERARAFLEETDPIKYRGLEPDVEQTETWRDRLLSFVDRGARSAQALISAEGT